MVSNVSFNGKQLGQNALSTLASLLLLPWNLVLRSFTTLKHHVPLSGGRPWGETHKVGFQVLWLSFVRFQPRRRPRKQNSSLWWGDSRVCLLMGTARGSLEPGSDAVFFVLLLPALQQGLQVWEGGRKTQRTLVKDAQLKAHSVVVEIVPPRGFLWFRLYTCTLCPTDLT